MAHFGTQSEPTLSVILVADLEDFSLWCPTVDPSIVGCFSERFFESANFLLGVLEGNFLKSTGDGIIALWDHPFDAKDPTLNQYDASLVVRSIERAATMTMALQALLFLRFGLSWATPRFLRTAIHVGVLQRTCFTRSDGPQQTDYVGEALNAACRLERYGQDVSGPVITQHTQAFLSTQQDDSLAAEVLEASSFESSTPKGAEWVSKQLFYLPSVEPLNTGQYQRPNDEMLAAVMKNMDAFVFRFMEALNVIFPKHVSTFEDMKDYIPEWMSILPSYVASFLKAEHFTVDERTIASITKGLKTGLLRWLRQQPHWRRSSSKELEAEINEAMSEATELFPRLSNLFLASDDSPAFDD